MSAIDTDTNLQEICSFCAEVGTAQGANLYYEMGICERGSREYILDETSSFVVMPCVGALVDTYVLVVSKRHVLSTGWLLDAERDELRELLNRWSARISEAGSLPVIFEHGSYSFRDKGGACYDHCHVHVVGADRTPSSFIAQVGEDVELMPSPAWLESAKQAIQKGERSYLAVSSSGGDFIGNSSAARSQFFRRHLAQWLGAEDGSWDWLVYPETTRVRAMIERLGARSGRGDHPV